MSDQKHYDNTNGSLYQFCDQKGLNSYEFDIIKRVMRSRKKGNFLEDLQKTKFLIDLYIKEMQESSDPEEMLVLNTPVQSKEIKTPLPLIQFLGGISDNNLIRYTVKK